MKTRSSEDSKGIGPMRIAIEDAMRSSDGLVRDAVISRWDTARSRGMGERTGAMQGLDLRIEAAPAGQRPGYPEEPEAATGGWIDPDEVPSRRSRWVFLHGAERDETDE